MKREEHVDFHLVRDEHLEIHSRLLQWARWVKPRTQGWGIQPMFRQYRSHAWQWERPTVKESVNTLQAVEMEKAVSALPEKHRTAIRWAYVWSQVPPPRVARELAVTKQGLLELVQAGRSMLRNRGV